MTENTSGAPSDDPTTNNKAARGDIGHQTYAAVKKLIDSGANKTEAFAKVAKETGRSAATVTTTYYRMAKREPGGGGVRQTAGATARRAKKATGAQAERLAHDARTAIDALHKHVTALEAQVEELAKKSREVDRIKKALKKI